MLRADQTIVFDTDVILPFRIYDGDGLTDAELLALIEADTAPLKDVTGWDLSFSVRKKVNTDDPPILFKEIGDGVTIEGVYGGSPEQTIQVRIAHTDTYDPTVSPPVLIKAASYFYALKRLDLGAETVLAQGRLTITRTAAWE